MRALLLYPHRDSNPDQLLRRQLFFPLNYGGIKIGSTVTFHYHVDIPLSLGDFIYPALTFDTCLRYPCPLCKSNMKGSLSFCSSSTISCKSSKQRYVSNPKDIGRLRFHPDLSRPALRQLSIRDY